jgi:tetraacyldisaccharide 4'-kinase
MRAPEFWNGHDIMARLAIAALSPIGSLYGATVAFKAARARPYRSSAKVVCVGNLTAGGTGKTPIAIAIARTLTERRLNTVVLTRGYGGRTRGPVAVDAEQDLANDMGDEALVLAAAAPVIVSRDRVAGARLAEAEGADAIVMDDGHQNFSLAKDLSLVVIDSEAGFGNGHMLPAGPLREPVAQGLARADAVIIVGDGDLPLPGFGKPALRAHLVPVDVLGLAGQRVVAFAGIGRPAKFFQTLQDLGAEVIEARGFGDHHVFTAAEMARLHAKARAADAQLITTEKDFARLTSAERQDIRYLPVRAAFEDMPAFEALLDRIAPRTLAPAAA